MWIYFSETGALRTQLIHGSVARQGGTGFELFCCFDNMGVSNLSATIALEDPNGDKLPVVYMMDNAELLFTKLPSESSTGNFVNNTTYNGKKWVVSDANIFSLHGNYLATVSLYDGTNKIVEGRITIAVEPAVYIDSYGIEESQFDELMRAINEVKNMASKSVSGSLLSNIDGIEDENIWYHITASDGEFYFVKNSDTAFALDCENSSVNVYKYDDGAWDFSSSISAEEIKKGNITINTPDVSGTLITEGEADDLYLNLLEGIVAIDNPSTNVSDYEQGQLFYSKSDNKLYQLNNLGQLILFNDPANNHIGLLTLSMVNGTLNANQLIEVNKEQCLIYLNTSLVKNCLVKKSISGNTITFYGSPSFSTISNDYTMFAYWKLVVNTSTGEYSTSTEQSSYYNKSQSEHKFLDLDTPSDSVSGAQVISAAKIFSVLPQSSVSPTGDNQLVNRKFVTDITGDIGERDNLQNQILAEASARSNEDISIHSDITTINNKMMSGTNTTDNQLANRNFVNSSINAMAAYPISYNAAGDNFPTFNALDSATTFYYAGEIRIPTKNDYAIVNADEDKGIAVDISGFTHTNDYVGYWVIYNNAGVEVTHDNRDSLSIVPGTTPAYENLPTTRYVFTGEFLTVVEGYEAFTSTSDYVNYYLNINEVATLVTNANKDSLNIIPGTTIAYELGDYNWAFQYIVNNSPFTEAQNSAINSGITAGDVAQISKNMSSLANNYDNTATYNIGDEVLYNGELYRCKTTISTAESWTASKWDLVNLADTKADKGVTEYTYQAKVLSADLLSISPSAWTPTDDVPTYNSSSTYVYGDIVSYDGAIYMAKDTNDPITGEFDANDWDFIGGGIKIYTSENVASSLGFVAKDDLATLSGTTPNDDTIKGDAGIFIINILSNSGTPNTTNVILGTSLIPDSPVNLTVSVFKQHSNLGSVVGAITWNDINYDSFSIVNSKLGVDYSKIYDTLDVIEHFQVNGIEQTITNKTVNISALPLTGGTMSGTITSQNIVPDSTANNRNIGSSEKIYSNVYAYRLVVGTSKFEVGNSSAKIQAGGAEYFSITKGNGTSTLTIGTAGYTYSPDIQIITKSRPTVRVYSDANTYSDKSIAYLSDLLDLIYPVGAVFTTTDANETITTLHNRLGGTWESLGNNLKIVNTDLEVKTKSTTHNVDNIALHLAANNTVTYNGNLARWSSTGNMVVGGGEPTGSPDSTIYTPDNLYAINDGVTIYAFKRTA